MNIWVTRHGQTNLNKARLMQGCVDEPLNDRGRQQAKEARQMIGSIKFDAVYASPLDRAIETATIIGNVNRDDIKIDERIIEANFGKYEKKSYFALGVKMTLYWAFPEVFKNPKTVESVDEMVSRSHEFLKELETKEYENVLVVCHGGIIRAICGYLEDRPSKIKWRPKPKNCEIRVYSSVAGKHSFVESFVREK